MWQNVFSSGRTTKPSTTKPSTTAGKKEEGNPQQKKETQQQRQQRQMKELQQQQMSLEKATSRLVSYGFPPEFFDEESNPYINSMDLLKAPRITLEMQKKCKHKQYKDKEDDDRNEPCFPHRDGVSGGHMIEWFTSQERLQDHSVAWGRDKSGLCFILMLMKVNGRLEIFGFFQLRRESTIWHFDFIDFSRPDGKNINIHSLDNFLPEMVTDLASPQKKMVTDFFNHVFDNTDNTDKTFKMGDNTFTLVTPKEIKQQKQQKQQQKQKQQKQESM